MAACANFSLALVHLHWWASQVIEQKLWNSCVHLPAGKLWSRIDVFIEVLTMSLTRVSFLFFRRSVTRSCLNLLINTKGLAVKVMWCIKDSLRLIKSVFIWIWIKNADKWCITDKYMAVYKITWDCFIINICILHCSDFNFIYLALKYCLQSSVHAGCQKKADNREISQNSFYMNVYSRYMGF